MTSLTLPARLTKATGLRPLNVFRDLGAVADLVELCFAGAMDSEGRSYVNQLRHAGRDQSYLRWAAGAASMPLTGYVWEEAGHIVGNVSLIKFAHRGKRIYLIANVAVHPDYRRRGIARALTERAMQHAREHDADVLWLHVRADNPGAVGLYSEMGFRERARRTTWQAGPERLAAQPDDGITIVNRHSRFWPQQRAWLERLYPDELAWYHAWDWDALRPGLWGWLYLLFVDVNVRQWAALRGGRLQGVLAWLPTQRSADTLWAALAPEADDSALTALLSHASRELHYRQQLSLDFPAGQSAEAISAAGFIPQRTLIWMQAGGSQ